MHGLERRLAVAVAVAAIAVIAVSAFYMLVLREQVVFNDPSTFSIRKVNATSYRIVEHFDTVHARKNAVINPRDGVADFVIVGATKNPVDNISKFVLILDKDAYEAANRLVETVNITGKEIRFTKIGVNTGINFTHEELDSTAATLLRPEDPRNFWNTSWYLSNIESLDLASLWRIDRDGNFYTVFDGWFMPPTRFPLAIKVTPSGEWNNVPVRVDEAAIY